MFTVRINPKIKAKPLATMKSAEAKVSESSTTLRKSFGSFQAEPNVVVRQFPPPNGCTVVRKRT